LARRARCWVSVSLSSIVPSRRYSKIGPCQSASRLGGPTTVTISPPGSWACPIGSAEVPKLASEVEVVPSLPDRVPGVGVGLSLPGEIPDAGARTFSSSQMEGLNNSCVNMPRGDGSWLDPNRAGASAASLSR
jgi:hypothetical protein